MSYKILLILVCIFLIKINCEINLNNTLNNNDTKLHQKCDGRLVDPDNIFTIKETNDICNLLLTASDFILRVRKFTDALVKGSILLEADSSKFFMTHCVLYNITMCSNGMLVDLYTEEKIVIIQPGSKSKIIVKDAYRNRVIETVRHNLIKGEWYIAVEDLILMLDYKNKNGVTKLNAVENKEATEFMYYTMGPIFAALFILIAVSLYYLELGFLNNDFFNYMDKMLIYWKRIYESEDKYIELPKDICLFCLKNNFTHKFLYCNHSYHERCLYKWRLLDDKCCPCTFMPIQGEESGDKNRQAPPILRIEDVKVLLGMLMDAHRKESLHDYFIVNEKKIQEFNERYDTCLEEVCWVHQNKLRTYKSNRIFYKMWKTLKLMCCIIAFYPSNIMNSKKGRLMRRLFNIKARGATVGGFK